jgi:hypothetical protein
MWTKPPTSEVARLLVPSMRVISLPCPAVVAHLGDDVADHHGALGRVRLIEPLSHRAAAAGLWALWFHRCGFVRRSAGRR